MKPTTPTPELFEDDWSVFEEPATIPGLKVGQKLKVSHPRYPGYVDFYVVSKLNIDDCFGSILLRKYHEVKPGSKSKDCDLETIVEPNWFNKKMTNREIILLQP